MAQRIDVTLVDDVDGTPATETVQFGLDGVSYEIDLSAENAAKLREELSIWLERGRRVGGRRMRGTKRNAVSTGPSLDEIRLWARENGYTVSDRGRIAQNIREAYDAAHAE